MKKEGVPLNTGIYLCVFGFLHAHGSTVMLSFHFIVYR